MKDLSVIIVNYNVKHFVDQCLRSVQVAIEGLDAEVFVVDNNSVDGSVPFLREHYPWVKLIANRENLGFAKANNVAIRQSTGRYVLLLNPDTIVQEDTFRKCVEFMNQNPDAGSLGVRMVNGDGHFLPESKRSLPTPRVAFYKIFGLSKLFPKSREFGRYHLTFLPESQTNEVEVLSGAYMMLRKETLDKIGLLDEDYFMYGEDIDLSYRVVQGGWKNYYYAGTQIVHYKGESTKKGSLNYVLVFYNAMLIFVRKHFSRGQGRWMTALIKFAIYFRASLSLAKRLVERALLPAMEFGVMALAFLGIAKGWFAYTGKQGSDSIFAFNSLGYAFAYVFFLALFGGYKRPFRIRSIFAGAFCALLAVALANYLMPPLNSSRMVVALTAGAALMLASLHRGVANFLQSGNFFLDQSVRKRLAIIAEPAEADRVAGLLQDEILYNCENFGTILPKAPAAAPRPKDNILGDITQLEELVRYYKLEEVIFCNASLSTRQIIASMGNLSRLGLEFKIVPPGSDYLVGPQTILTAHGLAPFAQGLHSQDVRLRKVIFDRIVSTALLVAYPLTFWIYKRPLRAIQAIVNVFAGKKHLVGYIDGSAEDLPRLKHGLLDMRGLVAPERRQNLQETDLLRLDRQYARNYSPALDWHITLRSLRMLGV